MQTYLHQAQHLDCRTGLAVPSSVLKTLATGVIQQRAEQTGHYVMARREMHWQHWPSQALETTVELWKNKMPAQQPE